MTFCKVWEVGKTKKYRGSLVITIPSQQAEIYGIQPGDNIWFDLRRTMEDTKEVTQALTLKGLEPLKSGESQEEQKWNKKTQEIKEQHKKPTLRRTSMALER